MGFNMNIQDCIAEHKQGLVSFRQITRPQFICKSDDDFIDYINYCWDYISSADAKLKLLSLMTFDDHVDIESLLQEVRRAHFVLELCHKFLSGKSAPIVMKQNKVYTTTLSHERR